MEEFVGGIWNRLITKQANSDFHHAEIKLSTLSSQLTTYFRAMGGSPSKIIEGAQTRNFNIQRRIIQRVAGTHRKFSVCWQDERSLRLPVKFALFPEKRLNENLYFWLTALAAQQEKIHNLFTDNQQATKALLKAKPGLQKIYQELATEVLLLRPKLFELTGIEHQRESAIQQAIKDPGSANLPPEFTNDPLPNPLWIYPAPQIAASIEGENIHNEEPTCRQDPTIVEDGGERKTAQRIDDSKETDGLLVFQLESLFSWTEQVALDRCQDENHEDDIKAAAQDLDIITLSRQRRSGSAKIKFDMDLPAPQYDELALGNGTYLPEWDFRKSIYLNNYCLLQVMLADDAPASSLPSYLHDSAKKIKSQFMKIRPERQWKFRQTFGEELDLDSWLDNKTQQATRSAQHNFYKLRSPENRDLSCLLLADLSMSTDSTVSANQRVIDVIQDTLLLFAEALSSSADPFSIYGFSSVKNKQIRYHLLKNFSEKYSDHIRGRIIAIKPGFYTRMGAAIRQSTKVLKLQKTQQRLLLIISDGKPNDIDHYEGRFGIEDTRQAILECKREGIRPFCVTIDAKGSAYLPYLFGDQGYTVVNDISRLPTLLPKLYLNLAQINI